MKFSISEINLRRLGKPVNSSVLAKILSCPIFLACFNAIVIRINARIKVVMAGNRTKEGKYPGLIAIRASSVALKKTARTI